jgi:phospholipid-binding lipoprotein MlaA
MRRLAALLCAVVVAGCATTGPVGQPMAANPADPWESWNRKVFAFNDALDENLLLPAARAYRDALPPLVRTGVDNVLNNLRDVWSAANQFLQGKVEFGTAMGMRVLTNTVFGLGGLLDPASEMGLVRRYEDFGQTLGRWGMTPGPYIVLPLFGPSSLRDTVGLVLDRQFAPDQLPPEPLGRFAVATLEVVDLRSSLLATTTLLDQVALDRYSFVRDAYLASRVNQVFDGAPPLEKFEDEPADPPPK